MSEIAARLILLVGGSDTGKSTYLGAVARNLIYRLGQLGCKFDNPEDRRQLTLLAKPIMDRRYPQHTVRDTDVRLTITLRSDALEAQGTRIVEFGDYSGEEVARAFEDRQFGWNEPWRERARRASALFVCLRADEGVLPSTTNAGAADTGETRLVDGQPAPFGPAAVLGADLSGGPATETKPRVGGAPVELPRALDAIETLQLIRHERDLAMGTKPKLGSLPVFVLLTAWDAVEESGWTPARLLAERYPLLRDFLLTNFHLEDVQVVGVSATGKDFHDPHFDAWADAHEDDDGGYVVMEEAEGSRRYRELMLPVCVALWGRAALDALARS